MGDVPIITQRMEATGVRHGGRTVQVVVYVNTDEDADQLAVRVCEHIAQSGKEPMTTGYALVLPANISNAIWEAGAPAARAAHAKKANA